MERFWGFACPGWRPSQNSQPSYQKKQLLGPGVFDHAKFRGPRVASEDQKSGLVLLYCLVLMRLRLMMLKGGYHFTLSRAPCCPQCSCSGCCSCQCCCKVAWLGQGKATKRRSVPQAFLTQDLSEDFLKSLHVPDSVTRVRALQSIALRSRPWTVRRA